MGQGPAVQGTRKYRGLEIAFDASRMISSAQLQRYSYCSCITIPLAFAAGRG